MMIPAECVKGAVVVHDALPGVIPDSSYYGTVVRSGVQAYPNVDNPRVFSVWVEVHDERKAIIDWNIKRVTVVKSAPKKRAK